MLLYNKYLLVLDNAHLLFKWCSGSENREIVSTFTTILIHDLSSALEQDNCKNMTTRRERIWGRYHDIWTSEHFRSTWYSFIQALIDCSNNPVMYQYIIDQIFSGIIIQVTSTSSYKRSNIVVTCTFYSSLTFLLPI